MNSELYIGPLFGGVEILRYFDSHFLLETIWPASREKGPSDITNSVDPDQPLHDFENIYT